MSVKPPKLAKEAVDKLIVSYSKRGAEELCQKRNHHQMKEQEHGLHRQAIMEVQYRREKLPCPMAEVKPDSGAERPYMYYDDDTLQNWVDKYHYKIGPHPVKKRHNIQNELNLRKAKRKATGSGGPVEKDTGIFLTVTAQVGEVSNQVKAGPFPTNEAASKWYHHFYDDREKHT